MPAQAFVELTAYWETMTLTGPSRLALRHGNTSKPGRSFRKRQSHIMKNKGTTLPGRLLMESSQ